MPTYRIFATSSELETLPSGIEVKERYPAFVVVSGTEEAVAPLRQRYPVEELESGSPSKAIPAIPSLATAVGTPQEEQAVIVRFHAPIRESWLETIRNAGATIHEFLGGLAVVAFTPNAEVRNVLNNLPEVEPVEAYVPTFRVRSEFLQELGTTEATEEQINAAALRLARGEVPPPSSQEKTIPGALVVEFLSEIDCEEAFNRFSEEGIEISARPSPTRLILNLKTAPKPEDAFEIVALQKGLRSLEEKTIKKLSNSVARNVIG